MKYYFLRAFPFLIMLLLVTPAWGQNCRLVEDIRTDIVNNNELDFMGPLHIVGDQILFAGGECNQTPELYTVAKGGDKVSMLINLNDDGTGTYCGTDPIWYFYNLNVFASNQELAYFTVPNTTFGSELWATDGTYNGTRLLKDICPGTCGSLIHDMLPWGSDMLFFAQDSLPGGGLWRTDGTSAGTTLIKRFDAPTPFYDLKKLTLINDSTACFIAVSSQGIYSIWKTDGTESGTAIVHTFPGNLSPVNIMPTSLGLFIPVYDQIVKNYPLWFSDGSNVDAQWLHDFDKFTQWSFSSIGGKALFAANTLSEGFELWQSDGTPAGTTLFKEFVAGASAGNPNNLTAFNGKIVFYANNPAGQWVVWESDGTLAGTKILADIKPYPNFNPILYNGKLYFFGTSDFASAGYQLWEYDGTQNGLTVLSSSFYNIQSIAQQGDLFAVSQYNATSEISVWQFDLSSGSITISEPLYGNNGTSNSYGVRAELGNELFFLANDGNSRQIWKTDVSNPGATKVTQFQYPDWYDNTPSQPTTAGDRIVFSHRTENEGGEIWQTKGDWATTALLGDFTPGPALTSAYPIAPAVSDGFFFVTYLGSNRKLWKYNLQAETAITLGQLVNNQHHFIFGDHLFFQDRPNSGTEFELWHSNGTPGTTGKFMDINPGPGSSNPHYFTNGGGTQFFFSANDGQHDFELWRSDGTTSGTAMVADINPNGGSKPFGLTWFQNQLYFFANNGISGIDLWKSDGTTAGTQLVVDMPAIPATGYFTSYTAIIGDNMVFNFQASLDGDELWVTDGTADGTKLLTDIRPGPASSNPKELSVTDTLVFFTAFSESLGRELWQTDGTPAGTKLTQDLNPGPASSSPSELGVQFGRLYFTAFTPEIGRELWTYAPDWATVPTLSPPSKENNCRVYPNPLSLNAGSLKVDCGDQSLNAANLYDATGRLLQTWQLEGKSAPFELNLSSKALIPGVYFLHLRGLDAAESGWERVILK